MKFALGMLAAFLLLPSLSLASDSIPLIRIGLRTDVSEAKISSDSPFFIGRLHAGLRPTEADIGTTWTFATSPNGVRVEDESGELRGVVSDTIFVYTRNRDLSFLKLDGKPYRGEMMIWQRENALHVINVLDLESYLLGVVPLEIGAQPDKRMAAMKAQAVAARSYTVGKMKRWWELGFDLMGTIEDQAYGGVQAERGIASQAVRETQGVIAVYKGEPIQAYYSSTCGGHGAAPNEVWPRGNHAYLTGNRCKTSRVEDSFCSISPRYEWKEIWDGPAFEQMLDRTLPGEVDGWSRSQYGSLENIRIDKRSASKRVSKLVLEFEQGDVAIGGDPIRWTIRRPNGSGLLSSLLVDTAVQKKNGRVTKVGISGRGFGHGVGLCQYGAMGMSEAGYDYTQILRFFYRGIGLWKFY